jgi:5-methylcytosine-specific restriction endonuclease McrA
MAKRDVTTGERLCTFIRTEVLTREFWPQVTAALAPTVRSAELAAFFEEVAAVHLTGRLVTGGRDISEEVGAIDDIASDEFEQKYRAFIRETTELSGKNRKEAESRLLRLGADAVRAARKGEIPSGVAKAVRRFAETRHRHCYLCGRTLLFVGEDGLAALDEEQRNLVYEAEHVWPQSYGGESEEENLLPACNGCNRAKGNYPCWAMVDVQSIALGMNPRQGVLDRISGPHRFALLSWAAMERAHRDNLTLKDAFRTIGPAITVRVLRPHQAADFFNLRNSQ